jgi:methionyl aminopeptidase
MRMNSNKSPFNSSGLFKLKGHDWLGKQREAGRIAAGALTALQYLVANKTKLSMQSLNEIAEGHILHEGGTCTFKGYKGFPAGVCISVNKQLVHGIPSDQVLKDGDIVSFDLGVTVGGAIADTAITCIWGEPKSERHVALVNATSESLMRGIKAIEVGKHLGVIGHAINKCAKGYGFGVIANYGGHGLDWDTPHSDPFVANKSEVTDGIRIQAGLAIAIEPMLVLGSTTTKVANDGWTVLTDDLGAHFEHSIYVHQDGTVEIITDRNKS